MYGETHFRNIIPSTEKRNDRKPLFVNRKLIENHDLLIENHDLLMRLAVTAAVTIVYQKPCRAKNIVLFQAFKGRIAAYFQLNNGGFSTPFLFKNTQAPGIVSSRYLEIAK